MIEAYTWAVFKLFNRFNIKPNRNYSHDLSNMESTSKTLSLFKKRELFWAPIFFKKWSLKKTDFFAIFNALKKIGQLNGDFFFFLGKLHVCENRMKVEASR